MRLNTLTILLSLVDYTVTVSVAAVIGELEGEMDSDLVTVTEGMVFYTNQRLFLVISSCLFNWQ